MNSISGNDDVLVVDQGALSLVVSFLFLLMRSSISYRFRNLVCGARQSGSG